MDVISPHYSYLVRWYVAHVRPHTTCKAAEWNDAWVQGTIRFGWQVALIGLTLLFACIFFPDDDRRWYCIAFGLTMVPFGMWHVRNAVAILELATGQQKIRVTPM